MTRLSASLLAAALLVGCGGSSDAPTPEVDRTSAAVAAAKGAADGSAVADPAADGSAGATTDAKKPAEAEATQPDGDGWITYGGAMSDSPAVAASAVIAAPADYVGKTVKVEGEVAAVCKSMGCWLTFQHEGNEFTVNMKDHGFSVDKQGAGRWCEAEGEVVKQGELYSLTASAVRLKKPAEAAPAEPPADDAPAKGAAPDGSAG